MDKMEIKISVRSLVEFLLRSGDIDNRHHAASDVAMQEGSRIHREIQKSGGPDYMAEVPLKYCRETDTYRLMVEGRADGIIVKDNELMIDEIKGTYRDLFFMHQPLDVHLAQAKCYAYMYLQKGDFQEVTIRMTYCNLETEEKRYFTELYSKDEIFAWFEKLLSEYDKWAEFRVQWITQRQNSMENLQFPFPYREGQKELVTYVYRTIYHERKLFIEAPTGVGKTISTVFPAVKAMERNMGSKLFYLTAKTITATVADQTIQILREHGLKFKSVVLTAKEKVCFLEKTDCNPIACPFAKGHFDRINDALYDILLNEDRYSRDIIAHYARKHQVCPFEFALDISLFCDGIVGDYNYLFDPHVYLKRFFAEGKKDYLFLIDEAHNLLERGREMYSALLIKEDFLRLKRSLTDTASQLEYKKSVLVREGYVHAMIKALEKGNKAMLALKKQCDGFRIIRVPDELIFAVSRLKDKMEAYLEETEEISVPVREEILDFYFILSHFLEIHERVDEKYVNYAELTAQGEFFVKLFCVDPSGNLRECMNRGRSTILFSATFLPIQYYKSLLGGEKEDYEVYANSVFDKEKRSLVIAQDVTSKFTRRNQAEYERICDYISEITQARKGNYLLFFPSYQYMETVYECYTKRYGEENCVLQYSAMNEQEREAFLGRFEEEKGEKTLLGFCVCGGIFSEGIDLKKDSLIGVIVVGTGLPQVCNERELLREYFQNRERKGYDYAYRYPGMNKVLQAAGRVIRTEEDLGVIALLDERFLQSEYVELFPMEWDDYERVSLQNVGNILKSFWEKHNS